MKSLIEEMGLAQFAAMLLVLCMIILGVYDCSSGQTHTYSCEIVDREIRTHYDKHHQLMTDYYLYAKAPDGVHCVEVTRTQFYSSPMGEIKTLRARYGKFSGLIYLEVIR